MAAWAEGTEGARRYLIQVAVDVQSDETLVAGYRLKLAVVVASGMLFSCGTGVLIARKGLKPLKQIAQATERITASQLHERLMLDGWPKIEGWKCSAKAQAKSTWTRFFSGKLSATYWRTR